MDITTKRKEIFEIYTDREVFVGVLTTILCVKYNPKSYNTAISNYETNNANNFNSGVVVLLWFSIMYLASDTM